ncbi:MULTISPECIES: lycopene beta-cyclase CrtY [Sphingomonas]|uniref:lycopene beta-cyclase CrtY n=1 Tax=Sphingomonas TaxID=13687 RepID=UPI000DEEE4CC|nr:MULTISPECIES: lycopene beta-cyclase CrtY [Sphingomonas]
MAAADFDLIILGGGLAGGLCALALAARRPELRVAIVEPGERIGGNHLWSFFASDVAPADRWLVDPLIGHRWPGYDVAFPAHRRTLDQPYQTIASEALDAAVRAALPPEAIIRDAATAITPTSVRLEEGGTLHAGAVLDARGGQAEGLSIGWQKFLGQLLDIPAGHGLTQPIVMDASVDQTDGYRFVYCLPFSATQVFVEDTYYTDGPELDRDTLHERIAAYAAAQGWRVAGISREEVGQLPVLKGGDFDAFWPAGDPVARAGARGGFFHPLTSYSLPDAVRFASWLATLPDFGALGPATRARAAAHWRRGGFDRLLSRMLFDAADPPRRYRVLERFYRLPAPLIARFYAGESSAIDRARILSGRPPVSVLRAVKALKEPQ